MPRGERIHPVKGGRLRENSLSSGKVCLDTHDFGIGCSHGFVTCI